LTKLEKCPLTRKLLKSWNGREEKEEKNAKQMREVMNCPRPQHLVWRPRSPTWPETIRQTEPLDLLSDLVFQKNVERDNEEAVAEHLNPQVNPS